MKRAPNAVAVGILCGALLATSGTSLAFDLMGQQAVLDAVVHHWIPSEISATLSIVAILIVTRVLSWALRWYGWEKAMAEANEQLYDRILFVKKIEEAMEKKP